MPKITELQPDPALAELLKQRHQAGGSAAALGVPQDQLATPADRLDQIRADYLAQVDAALAGEPIDGDLLPGDPPAALADGVLMMWFLQHRAGVTDAQLVDAMPAAIAQEKQAMADHIRSTMGAASALN